jgi:molybdenum cofactor cytidylyltransferase
MGLTLRRALRLDHPASQQTASHNLVAFVGSGGKTTAIFTLARETPAPVAIAATTHLGLWQASLADQHVIANRKSDIQQAQWERVTLFTGPVEADNRIGPLSSPMLELLRDTTAKEGIDLLIEADGSRQLPLKAPDTHEPAIPAWASTIVVVAGMLGLGLRLDAENVHRPEIFADVAGISPGAEIGVQALQRVLSDPKGGLKGIPSSARRVVLLNQADNALLQSEAQNLAKGLVGPYETAIVASLKEPAVFAAHELSAGIILAAGAATRFGRPKQLLPWQGKPLVVGAAQTALDAGLQPVIVVVGAYAQEVQTALKNMPVDVAMNEGWQDGQSTSVVAGLSACQAQVGSAIFLLADQPGVSAAVVRALVELHAAKLSPIVAPIVNDDRRANPVLFDRSTFTHLLGLKGDTGGRAIFSAHKVEYLPWHDESLLWEIDTPDDYDRLAGSSVP